MPAPIEDQLTEEELTNVATNFLFLAGAIGSLLTFRAQTESDRRQAWAAIHVDPALAKLEAGTTIPNPTNYAGAGPITVEEYKALQLYLRGLKDTLATVIPGDPALEDGGRTYMEVFVKAAGVNADIGALLSRFSSQS